MIPLFQAQNLSRSFQGRPALRGVSCSLSPGHVVGLIGRNGSGKTTLLNHMVGLLLPDSGQARTFGVPAADFGPAELGRIGMVHQENRLLAWMKVDEHLRYVAAYHPTWDEQRERALVQEFELDREVRVAHLSPGGVQKLALILAVCARPQLILLDEPASSLDPIAREQLLSFLLELVREDGTTVVISSHVLRDIERVVDRVLCLREGRLIVDSDLDDLRTEYAEWIVTPRNGVLTGSFGSDWILESRGDEHRAVLTVHASEDQRAEFEALHGVDVEARALNLERMFPHLLARGKAGERTKAGSVAS